MSPYATLLGVRLLRRKIYKKSRCVFILGSARLVFLIFVTSMQVSVGSVSIISRQSQSNLENGVVSPFLHSYVHKRSGKKTRYIYTRLVDGVHPTRALSAAGTRHLETTIDQQISCGSSSF
jgi:hypothetical protein